MRVLVTGGAGFIGSALVRRLASHRNMSVTVLDNLHRGRLEDLGDCLEDIWFLEADIRETAGGNEQELVKRAEAVIEKQLSGIYKMFIRLGSPEFVIRRIAAVHSTYFDGVQIIPEMKGPNKRS